MRYISSVAGSIPARKPVKPKGWGSTPHQIKDLAIEVGWVRTNLGFTADSRVFMMHAL